MPGCPNSTESGCRCPEHHPGLLAFAPVPAEPVRLHLVTPGPCTAPSVRTDGQLARLRASCATCRGDADVCNAGDGARDFERLHGCAAWTPAGALAELSSTRQPWEPRPPRERLAVA